MRKLAAALLTICFAAVGGYAAIAAGALAASQSGHAPVVGVSIACDGNVTWTATAWDGPTRQSRSNPTVVVSAILDGTEHHVVTGGFSASYNFAFGGSFQTDSDTVTIRAHVSDSWGDRTPGGQTVAATVSKSPECSPAAGDPTEEPGGETQPPATTTGDDAASTGPTATTTVGTSPPSAAEDQYGTPPAETTAPTETVEQQTPPTPAPNTVVIVYKSQVIIGCAAGFSRIGGRCWMVPR